MLRTIVQSYHGEPFYWILPRYFLYYFIEHNLWRYMNAVLSSYVNGVRFYLDVACNILLEVCYWIAYLNLLGKKSYVVVVATGYLGQLAT